MIPYFCYSNMNILKFIKKFAKTICNRGVFMVYYI